MYIFTTPTTIYEPFDIGTRHIESIFHKSQSGSVTNTNVTSSSANSSNGPTEEQIEYEASVLDFIEFWEAISNIAVYESPDPYITLGIKVSIFIEKVMLPRFDIYVENGVHGVKNYVARGNVN